MNCGVGVSSTFFAVMRCSLFFFSAVLRCLQSQECALHFMRQPHVPRHVAPPNYTSVACCFKDGIRFLYLPLKIYIAIYKKPLCQKEKWINCVLVVSPGKLGNFVQFFFQALIIISGNCALYSDFVAKRVALWSNLKSSLMLSLG